MGHVEFFGLPSCNLLVDSANNQPVCYFVFYLYMFLLTNWTKIKVMWMIVDRKYTKQVDQILRTTYSKNLISFDFWLNAKILKEQGKHFYLL